MCSFEQLGKILPILIETYSIRVLSNYYKCLSASLMNLCVSLIYGHSDFLSYNCIWFWILLNSTHTKHLKLFHWKHVTLETDNFFTTLEQHFQAFQLQITSFINLINFFRLLNLASFM